MAPLDSAVEMFEGKSSRILWLPSITLAYIFTLSGSIGDFALAVVSIGGARFYSDLAHRDSDNKTEDDDVIDASDILELAHNMSAIRTFIMAIVSAIYVFSIFYSSFRLYQHFTHTDIVIVSLAGVYWGILIVIVIAPKK